MVKMTPAQTSAKLRTTERKLRSMQNELQICEMDCLRFREELAEERKPKPKDESVKHARNLLRDLGLIGDIMGSWNSTGQIKLLQAVNLMYNEVPKE